jgi:hypothetical protein
MTGEWSLEILVPGGKKDFEVRIDVIAAPFS